MLGRVQPLLARGLGAGLARQQPCAQLDAVLGAQAQAARSASDWRQSQVRDRRVRQRHRQRSVVQKVIDRIRSDAADAGSAAAAAEAGAAATAASGTGAGAPAAPGDRGAPPSASPLSAALPDAARSPGAALPVQAAADTAPQKQESSWAPAWLDKLMDYPRRRRQASAAPSAAGAASPLAKEAPAAGADDWADLHRLKDMTLDDYQGSIRVESAVAPLPRAPSPRGQRAHYVHRFDAERVQHARYEEHCTLLAAMSAEDKAAVKRQPLAMARDAAFLARVADTASSRPDAVRDLIYTYARHREAYQLLHAQREAGREMPLESDDAAAIEAVSRLRVERRQDDLKAALKLRDPDSCKLLPTPSAARRGVLRGTAISPPPPPPPAMDRLQHLGRRAAQAEPCDLTIPPLTRGVAECHKPVAACLHSVERHGWGEGRLPITPDCAAAVNTAARDSQERDLLAAKRGPRGGGAQRACAAARGAAAARAAHARRCQQPHERLDTAKARAAAAKAFAAEVERRNAERLRAAGRGRAPAAQREAGPAPPQAQAGAGPSSQGRPPLVERHLPAGPLPAAAGEEPPARGIPRPASVAAGGGDAGEAVAGASAASCGPPSPPRSPAAAAEPQPPGEAAQPAAVGYDSVPQPAEEPSSRRESHSAAEAAAAAEAAPGEQAAEPGAVATPALGSSRLLAFAHAMGSAGVGSLPPQGAAGSCSGPAAASPAWHPAPALAPAPPAHGGRPAPHAVKAQPLALPRRGELSLRPARQNRDGAPRRAAVLAGPAGGGSGLAGGALAGCGAALLAGDALAAALAKVGARLDKEQLRLPPLCGCGHGVCPLDGARYSACCAANCPLRDPAAWRRLLPGLLDSLGLLAPALPGGGSA
ncbi:hypothetical protein HT031_001971 [Scenedesmus sp. PABB004]|nr:hypothetical protein HT031_001971 [Scenedesmus sp. PABB004]